MTFGELFAGIGGFSLGLERAGMQCKWQVEIDPYASAVLKKHWPEVSKWDDVRTFPPQGDWGVDLICGGFPCQDISVAGKGAGLAGARSGLWHEFARIIGELRPRYVVVENVAALLTRGMDSVLGTLSTLGYDAEWHVIPASAVGAPHRRERVWIVAQRSDAAIICRSSDCGPGEDVRGNRQAQKEEGRRRISPDAGGMGCCVPDTDSGQVHRIAAAAGNGGTVSCEGPMRLIRRSDGRGYVADSICEPNALRGNGSPCSQGVARRGGDAGRSERDSGPGRAGRAGKGSCDVPNADRAGRQQQRRPQSVRAEQPAVECGGWWESEPDVGRVAHGVPSRVDRLRCLGNAVVPQVVEIIGRAILAHEERSVSA